MCFNCDERLMNSIQILFVQCTFTKIPTLICCLFQELKGRDILIVGMSDDLPEIVVSFKYVFPFCKVIDFREIFLFTPKWYPISLDNLLFISSTHQLAFRTI